MCIFYSVNIYVYINFYVYIQLLETQYSASKMFFVDFVWFPEQAPIALGYADVTCLLEGRVEILSI